MRQLLFSTLVLLFACGTAFAGDAKDFGNAAYQKAGKAVIDMVNAKSVDAAAVQAKVAEMVTASVGAARAYAGKHPEGKKLIEAVIAEAAACDAAGNVTGLGKMKDQTFAVIEDQWHNLGHFKTVDVGLDLSAEKNEHFTDPLHAIIHPVMVLRAALDYAADKKAEHLQHMKEEMDEGLEQMEKVTTALR